VRKDTIEPRAYKQRLIAMTRAPTPRKAFTNEELDAAANLLRQKRPDLWSQWERHEKQNEGYADIMYEIIAVWRELPFVTNLIDGAELNFEIRRRLRISIGLPV
jgi:hypothetical protein